MNKNRVTIHCTTKDRHSEIALCLQSLRTQTFQDWDLILLDDASGTHLTTHHPTNSLINRIKLENHRVKTLRNDISDGVCGARNKLIQEDTFDNEFVLRIDDDCVYEPDYIEKLMSMMNDCDLATGVVPLMYYPELIRDVVPDTICLHELNDKGELIKREDELAYTYLDEQVVDCHQFRTNCLYRKEITDEGVKYPTTLTKSGFREELWFSFQSIIKGYKIKAHLGAVSYHLQTQSGGCRSPTYNENVMLDEDTTNKWIKKMYEEHGDFLK